MALTHDPETGGMTTTFLLEQRSLREERERRRYEIEREVNEHANCWRTLVERVGLTAALEMIGL